MAHPAFSALLNWQIGETKHQILILLGVDISSTYFYSHLLPSNKLDLIPMFYFVKWGQGGTREREVLLSNKRCWPVLTGWCGPSETFQMTWLSQVMPRSSFKGLRRTSTCPGEGAEARAWPGMSVSLQTSFLLWSRNGKHMQKRSGFHQPVIYSTVFTPWIISIHACSFGLSQCSAALPPHLSHESECFTLPPSGCSHLI